VLAAGSAAKIFAADDDRVIAFEFLVAHKTDVSVWQARFAIGDAAHGVHAEKLPLHRNRGIVRKVLGGNDLIVSTLSPRT